MKIAQKKDTRRKGLAVNRKRVKPVYGPKVYFPGIPPITYEGADSDNPLAFKHYNENRMVGGKTMKEHLRFAVAYWHSLCGNGQDMFGAPTWEREWNKSNDPMTRAREKMDAAFELITKLGIPFYCFHDFDLVAEADTVRESEKRLQIMVDNAKEKQKASGVQLLWGTANLFSHPRYMNGAATNPEFAIVARAGAQVKAAIDATIALGGKGYVFWGGREGYLSLLNTDMKREVEHLGRFLTMARDYGRKHGFAGTFFIEPKPMEPTKHQYDYDAATVLNFLRAFDLLGDFALNIEVNHATLAGHTFQHELQVAADAGALGSIDANRGDYQNGWDTDEFPMDLFELTQAMLVILDAGGLKPGGINFDAKLRRSSTDLEDLFIAHINGMDSFARALVTAQHILTDSPYHTWRKERYATFNRGDGSAFEKGTLTLDDLRRIAIKNGRLSPKSGKQEAYEMLVNRYL
ncbi:MAG: xylose isomerase [Chitinispirillaceae bacterium]|nr:xylose isomerase [Chitinispirillaceae bacterium]